MSRAAKATTKLAPLVSGVRDLGGRLGLSGPAAANWVNHAEWPFGRGPWPAIEVDLMARWIREANTSSNAASRPEVTDGENDPKKLPLLARAKFKKIVRETEGIEIRNKVLNGEYVEKAEVEADYLRKFETIKRRMLAMPNRLPFDEQMKEVVRRHVREEFELLSSPK